MERRYEWSSAVGKFVLRPKRMVGFRICDDIYIALLVAKCSFHGINWGQLFHLHGHILFYYNSLRLYG